MDIGERGRRMGKLNMELEVREFVGVLCFGWGSVVVIFYVKVYIWIWRWEG